MTNYHRIPTIIAGLYTFLQAIAWVVLTVYGITIYTCLANFPTVKGVERVDYLFELAYFTGPCTFDVVIPAGQRTYVFMYIYMVLNLLWIPASFLLLVAAIGNVKGKYAGRKYIPWIIMTSLMQLLDLIGTVFYAVDISNTLTADQFQDFVHPLPIFMLPIEFDGLTVIPSVLMTLFCSRAVVGWIVNAIFLGVVIQAKIAVSRWRRPTEWKPQKAESPAPAAANASVWVSQRQVESPGPKRYNQVEPGPKRYNQVEPEPQSREGSRDLYPRQKSRPEEPWEKRANHPWVVPEPEGARQRQWVKQDSRVEAPQTFGWAEVTMPGTDNQPPNQYVSRQRPTANDATPDIYNKPWSYVTQPGELQFVQNAILKPDKPVIPPPDYNIRYNNPKWGGGSDPAAASGPAPASLPNNRNISSGGY